MRLATKAMRWIGAAAVGLVALAGCYSPDDYRLTPNDVNALLKLEVVGTSTSVPADGFSRLQIVARILKDFDKDRGTIVFKTSDGSFDPTADLKEKEVAADADGNAFIELRSSETIGTVQVSAQVKGVDGLLQQLEVRFVDVPADNIIAFVEAPRSARADGITVSTFTVQINRSVPADKRMVTFKTTAGTFVASGGTDLMVDASSAELVSVQLKSPAMPATGQVSASVNKATALATITFTQVQADDILRFITTTASAPADGATRSTFTVKVANQVPPEQAMVMFKTTAGTFAVSMGPAETVQANSSHQATAQLVSPLALTTARVTATLAGTTRETSIRFVAALADKTVQVTADPIQLTIDPTQPGPQATVVVKLVRNVGTVTPGSTATLTAFGINNQRVGFFSNITVSDNMGQLTATYVPGSTTYRGEVTLQATADGTSVNGHTIIRLVDPPVR
jgi:hypothetical protein